MPTTGAVASITAGGGGQAGGGGAGGGRDGGGGAFSPGPRGGTMPVAGAVAPIAAAATSHAVASLTLSTPYAISGAPSWVTAWSVGAKTAGGFPLTFAAPAPAA